MRVVYVAAEEESAAARNAKKAGFKEEVYEENLRPSRVWIATPWVAESKSRALAVEGHAQAVVWNPLWDRDEGGAPDRRIAMSYSATPLVDDVMMGSNLQIIDADADKVTHRIPHKGKLGSFTWDVDGDGLAFIGAQDEHDPHAGTIFIVYAGDGSAEKEKAWDLGPRTVEMSWLKPKEREFDYQQIAWPWQLLAGPKALIDVGTKTKLLTGVGQTSFPPYEVGKDERLVFVGINVARIPSSHYGPRDGIDRIVLLGQSPTHPTELFAHYPEGDKWVWKRLTHSNPGLESLKLGKQETITWKARDGLELEGVLIHPLDEQPGQRYPLILVVHGGPEAHNRDGWLTNYLNPGQMAAARGYAVFYPNYRGSTGRGVEFSKLGQGDPAGKEFDDLIDAVDHLVATGLVDKDKVGITGGSYGGYATAWCCTRYTDRFAAGVMFVGISDLVSKVGTTDIPNEEILVHALKPVSEDWQKALERSPIYYAAKAHTPLLILGGKDDPRVDPGQSKELYRQLKIAGNAPVRLVQYPGEQHGNQKACARLDYSLRMLEWFDWYLKGPGGAPPPAEISHDDPAAATR
jgi:dipeptidyl aminopeptidase/acylaminoacyl peptidase